MRVDVRNVRTNMRLQKQKMVNKNRMSNECWYLENPLTTTLASNSAKRSLTGWSPRSLRLTVSNLRNDKCERALAEQLKAVKVELLLLSHNSVCCFCSLWLLSSVLSSSTFSCELLASASATQLASTRGALMNTDATVEMRRCASRQTWRNQKKRT